MQRALHRNESIIWEIRFRISSGGFEGDGHQQRWLPLFGRREVGGVPARPVLHTIRRGARFARARTDLARYQDREVVRCTLSSVPAVHDSKCGRAGSGRAFGVFPGRCGRPASQAAVGGQNSPPVVPAEITLHRLDLLALHGAGQGVGAARTQELATSAHL